MNPTTVDAGVPLTPRDVVAVARLGAQVTVGEDAMERVKRASDLVESLADDPTPHYGISTGFGALASTRVPRGSAAFPHPFPRRVDRTAGRERGHPRHDDFAPQDDGIWPHRSTPGGRHCLRRSA